MTENFGVSQRSLNPSLCDGFAGIPSMGVANLMIECPHCGLWTARLEGDCRNCGKPIEPVKPMEVDDGDENEI